MVARNRVKVTIMKYAFISLVFISKALIPIRKFFNIEDVSIAMFISAAILIFIIDTFLYIFTITGLHFYIRKTKNPLRNMILIYSIIAIEVVYSYVNVHYFFERAI